MPESPPPVELDSLAPNKRTKQSSQLRGVLIGTVLGALSAVGLFFFVKAQIGKPTPQHQSQTTPAADENTTSNTADARGVNSAAADPQAKSETNELASNNDEPQDVASENNAADSATSSTTEQSVVDAAFDEADPTDSAIPVTALLAKKPEATLIAAAAQASSSQPKTQPSSSTAGSSANTKEEEKREDIKLSDRRWTTLVLFQNPAKGEAPIPENFPVWNFPKGYQFEGSKHDQHRLGNFKVDGEFIIRDGYLRREFGNTALLHLPPAKDFDLEGIASFEGIGGWLMLVGWEIETKSGYVIYNTKLKNPSPWFAIEIKDGKPVPNTERVLVDRRIEGEGALRVRIDGKKVSMQVADGYLFRDEELPNYKEGHVAIGTYSPQYGPQNVGIKSLRMKLR